MTALVTIAAGVLLIVHLLAVALYLRRLNRSGKATGSTGQNGSIGQPFVTLLRPVCGLDPFDAQTLRSSFRQDYPHYEIIFCAQSHDDPAVGLVRRLIAEHPDRPARLLIGYDAVTRNPKLNNVWKGWHSAASDWICMTDSNLDLLRDYLSVVVASWGARTGLVSSPPIGTCPQNLAAGLECAFLNGNQALLQYASDSLGQAFAQGKTLFFHRPLIEKAGGLRLLGKTLAEDAAATQAVHAIGRKVSLTPLPFAQPIGQRTWQAVWSRQLRWSRVRRDAFPLLFVCEILNGAVVPTALAAMAVHLSGSSPWIVPVYAGLWYLAEYLVCRRAGWPMGRMALGLFILRDLMMPALWVATYARRGFEWRGTAMSPQEAPDNAPATGPQDATRAVSTG